MRLHLLIVDAYQLFVEGDGQGRLSAELCHTGPLSLADGLFDAVDGILREQFQLVEGLLVGEAAVGIQT